MGAKEHMMITYQGHQWGLRTIIWGADGTKDNRKKRWTQIKSRTEMWTQIVDPNRANKPSEEFQNCENKKFGRIHFQRGKQLGAQLGAQLGVQLGAQLGPRFGSTFECPFFWSRLMSLIFWGSLKSFFYICNYWWWNGQLSKWARLVLSSPCTTLHRCTSIKKHTTANVTDGIRPSGNIKAKFGHHPRILPPLR